MYPPQVEHLWFQQKQVEAISHKYDCALYGRMGNYYTVQCGAMVMCAIITGYYANLARSMKIEP